MYFYRNNYVCYKAENSYGYIYTNSISKIDIISYTSPTSISWPSNVTAETPTGGSLNINENDLQLTNVRTIIHSLHQAVEHIDLSLVVAMIQVFKYMIQTTIKLVLMMI